MKLAIFKTATALAAMAALGGCVSFGRDAPDRLIALTAEEHAPAGEMASGMTGSAILILDPDADRRIDVERVAVQMDSSSVSYLKDATWVEKPARQFRRLLAETVRARANRVVVEGSDYEVSGATTVSGRLSQMGYDALSQSVVVQYDAVVEEEDGSVRSRRFQSEVPGIAADVTAVAPALNQAANDVAKQVAAWLLGQPG